MVNPPFSPIVILSVSPNAATVNTGGLQAFIALATRQDGSSLTPTVSWSATGGTITTGGLYTAGTTAGTFRVIARQQSGTLADTALIAITASAGTTLLSESFESGSLAAHGWFDVTTVAVATDARPGSAGTHVLQWRWATGSVAPQGASRIDFTPSNGVYLSYWVKMSTNWIGSGKAYHPHLFHFITDADDHYTGLASNHLTTYDELLYKPGQGGMVYQMAAQDAANMNVPNFGVDLTGVTENRAVCGGNGQPEAGFLWEAFSDGGGGYQNDKRLNTPSLVITDATKNSWHHVESYWQMNTISNGIGQPDGVMQLWIDGVPQLDRHDVYFRTGAAATKKFRTLVMAPYIGDGSPVDQYMWIDDLVVATARP
jgi:hypothetical protein